MSRAKSSGTAYEFGYRSAPLIITAGVAVGVVLSMHTRASLERFGAEAMIPAGLAIALIRETGPSSPASSSPGASAPVSAPRSAR
jgi:phospholipid/cholesterol/gamma-HCH transport system permease protein